MASRFRQVQKGEFDYQQVKSGEMEWSRKPGVYLMVFPNGMKYLGKSNHLGKRLISHISGFRKGEKWYGAAKQTFCDIEEPSFYQVWEAFRDNVVYYITYDDKPEELEQEYLKRIELNFRTKEYYNTQYPEVTYEEWMDSMFGGDQND